MICAALLAMEQGRFFGQMDMIALTNAAIRATIRETSAVTEKGCAFMKRKRWGWLWGALVALLIVSMGIAGRWVAENVVGSPDQANGTAAPVDATAAPDDAVATPADMSTEPVATAWVEITVAGYGTITAELYGHVAPITVTNFLKLAGEGFYDGLTFHRIISGFMIQGGDPKGNGTGGSEETIKGEFSANGVPNSVAHTRGVLSMARAMPYDSASSQFFIMHADAPHLNGQYAAFGRVVSGMEVVDAICADTPVLDSNGTVAAADQPVIERIVIIDQPAE